MDKNIQLVGIVLLYLVGLNGSEDILGKKRAWLLLSVRKFVLHPLIHIFGSRKVTTIWGGGSERARVWIKVCNSHSG